MPKLKIKSTTATAVKDEPKAKTDKAPKEKAASKYVSVDVVAATGQRMRVAEYQDYTFSVNDQPKRRLTDEELAADWRKQFPNAVAFTPFHVAGARRDYNKGVHSKAYAGKHDSRAWFADAKGAKTQTEPKAAEPTPKAKAVKETAENPKPVVARKKTKAA